MPLALEGTFTSSVMARLRSLAGRPHGTIAWNVAMLGGLGLSQAVFEWVLASHQTAASFEAYVTARNVLLVFFVVCSLGMNELIVRYEDRDRRKATRFFWILVGSALACAIAITFSPLSILDRFQGRTRVLLSVCLFGFTVAQGVASRFRGRRRFFVGLLCRDGWRISAWGTFVVVLLGLSAATGFLVATLLIYCAAAVLAELHAQRADRGRGAREGSGESIPAPDLVLAASFWLTMVSLASVSYFDQILLDMLAPRVGELRTYALAVTFVLTPFVLVASATGIVLVPTIVAGTRIRPALQRMVGLARRGGVATGGAILGVLGGYYLVVNWVSQRVGVQVSPSLYVLLVGIGISRIAYSVPSSALGAQAGARPVLAVALVGIVGIGLQVLLSVALYRLLDLGIVGIAMGTFSAWVLRLTVAVLAVRRLAY